MKICLFILSDITEQDFSIGEKFSESSTALLFNTAITEEKANYLELSLKEVIREFYIDVTPILHYCNTPVDIIHSGR